MSTERETQIHPIVQESIMHNNKARPPTLYTVFRPANPDPQTLSNLYSLTSSLFGVTAGILGLESYYGFLLYLFLSIITTTLVYTLKVAPDSLAEERPVLDTQRFVKGAAQFWTGGLMSGLSGFVLTWTLFYGLVRV